MRIRVRNNNWRDVGPAHGQLHRWDRVRRTIEEQLASAFPRRLTTLPQINATIERH